MADNTLQPEGRSIEQMTYTVEEVATMLNMKTRSAYNFCGNTDKFIVKRVGKNGIRVHMASFDSWLNSPDGCSEKGEEK